jgi:hypothetical protein
MLGARRLPTLAIAAALLAAAVYPTLDRMAAARRARRGIDALAGVPADLAPLSAARLERLGPLLASWETIGGCGAGASTATGGGLKWIGRNTTGGAVHVELQSAYLHTDYGYNYVETALITRDLNPKWNLGLSIPYLYKFMRDPYGLGVNVINQGPGDLAALVTRRLGTINDWTTTLSIGAPTGAHDAYFRTTDNYLPQDRQLGLGPHTTTFVTASAIVEHTIDRDWGLAVIGGNANWRGGTNELQSKRVPTASLYSYTGYLLGPLVPALGLTVTGAAGHDVDRLMVQSTPIFTVAASASLEWSTDWMAVLIGGSVPYGYTNSIQGSRPVWALAPWVMGLGVSFAPF